MFHFPALQVSEDPYGEEQQANPPVLYYFIYLASQTWRADKTFDVYEKFNITGICTNEIPENKLITTFKFINA